MSTVPLPAASARRVYLDFNASTPLAPEVVSAMEPLLREHYGNPSSQHWAGPPARRVVEEARAEVAALLNAALPEIVFTSGGTEANNHAIKGVVFRRGIQGAHIVTTEVEHPAVLEPCRFLERLGATVTRLAVDSTGMVDPDDVRRALNRRTVLVSVMHANNEVGTIEPISAIARIARERGVLFHVDAAQSVGKIDVDVQRLGVDLLSVAGHKLYAPKGVGALYMRDELEIEPLMHGAGHEDGRRAGTENVLLAAGLGAACRLARLDPCGDRLGQLAAFLWSHLQAEFGDAVVLNGHPTERLPNTLNVSFRNRKGHELLGRLEGVAASTGSACHAGATSMSPVLAAMGIGPEVGIGAIRFSVGRTTTQDDLEQVVEQLKRVV
ncbi:MAG: cysteine desulfurase [Acidobacteria bacterium]|nr:cysteine desulfurase [Acidobacteriota bacterium]